VRGLIINKSIRTTRTKAKEASRLADRLITLGKDKTVLNQRRAYSILGNRKLVSALFNELAPLFKDRNGGYTRVMLLQNRRGDNAQLAILEFVEKPKIEPAKKPEKKEKKKVPHPAEPKVEMQKKPPEPRKEEPREKEGRKKELPAQKEPKKPEKPIQKPGFFKRFFGRKGD